METMKAARIHTYGGPEVLKYEEAPRPKPGPGEQLTEIATLIDSGQLKAIVETVLPLSEARQAQELSQSGHTWGKIVLQVM